MDPIKSRKIAIAFILVFQAVLVLLYLLFVQYDTIAVPQKPIVVVANSTSNTTTSRRVFDDAEFASEYAMFQDIQVMVFVGFGFLMTFLKKYAFTSLGLTFMIACVVLQWGILCQGFLEMRSIYDRINVNMISLISADIAAAVILISLGAVLGKITPIQTFYMGVLETVFYVVNLFFCEKLIHAVDAGGSMIVHAFGAYFGLAVSFVLARGVATENEENKLEGSSYQSDIFAMIGTLFLWVFWPSFTAGLLPEAQKLRAVINAYLALTASCLTVLPMSVLLNKDGKFEMAHVQNATLAGGVAIGTVINMIIQPYTALIIGSLSGILSILGFRYVQNFLRVKMHIHDTCGVNNLHGMPGILAGVIGVILAMVANEDTYQDSLSKVFPGRGPPENRSAFQQAGYQFLALTVTIAFSIVSGLITGALLRSIFPKVQPKDYYNDEIRWKTPESNNE